MCFSIVIFTSAPPPLRQISVASSTVKRGKKVANSRLSNKGAVALAFRLHATTLAFVACHLASDSKGKNNQGSRDKDTQSLLGEMELSYDAVRLLPFMQRQCNGNVTVM